MVCAGQQYRHYIERQPALLRTLPHWLIPSVPSDFTGTTCSGRPALLKRRWIETSATLQWARLGQANVPFRSVFPQKLRVFFSLYYVPGMVCFMLLLIFRPVIPEMLLNKSKERLL